MLSKIGTALGVLVVLSGCRFDPVAAISSDAGPPDVLSRDIDLRDAVGEDRPVGGCDPQIVQSRCAGDGVTVQTCELDGTWSDAPPCDLGCVSDGNTARCATSLIFSNSVPYYAPGDLSSEITTTGCDHEHPIVIDTTALTVTLDGNSVLSDPAIDTLYQANSHGIELMVLPLVRFVVPQQCRVRVVGQRALAIVTEESIEVSGTIDASAERLVSGPGALPPGLECDGKDGLNGGASGLGGGGGGGRFDKGGAGGGAPTVAGAGGDAIRNAMLVPLMGGCRGGSGAERVVTSTLGGLGGGAVMLASGGEITISGTLRVSGGNGASSETAAGGGGGSGGSLLIEAPHVVISGRLEAEGGSGGTGGDALGGLGGRDDQPVGGDGVAVDGLGGGGGGAVGQIRINTLAGMPADLSGTLSPSVNHGAIVVPGGLKAQ